SEPGFTLGYIQFAMQSGNLFLLRVNFFLQCFILLLQLGGSVFLGRVFAIGIFGSAFFCVFSVPSFLFRLTRLGNWSMRQRIVVQLYRGRTGVFLGAIRASYVTQRLLG